MNFKILFSDSLPVRYKLQVKFLWFWIDCFITKEDEGNELKLWHWTYQSNDECKKAITSYREAHRRKSWKEIL